MYLVVAPLHRSAVRAAPAGRAGGAGTVGRVSEPPLHVSVAGDGPALVLLHGNGEDARSLAPVAGRLAEDHRVIAPDARAHGRSPRGTGPLTIARMADDVADVLGGLGVTGPVDVVGYSDGGNVALLLALRHPRLVRSLVLYGANTEPAGLSARTRAEVTLTWLAQRARGLVDARARARAEVTDLMVHQPRIPLRALARVEVPVLVAAGEHDVVRRAHTEAVAAHLPRGRAHVVAGADHGLPLDDPAAFTALVRAFLADLPA